MEIKEKKNLGEGIIGGALSLTVATVVVKLLGVLYKIPLANVLGDEGMGYFNTAYTVYSFFYLLCTAGVPKSVMILISERLAENEHAGVKKILEASVKAFTVIGFAVSLGFVLFAKPLSGLIGNSEAYVTMVCVAPSIVFSSVSGVLRGYLSAKMRLLSIAVSQVVEGAVKLALGLLLALLAIRLEMSLPMISAFTILGTTLGSFASLVYLSASSKSEIHEENIEQNKKSLKTRGILNKILKISLPITVSAALMNLSGICDLFLVMRRLCDIGYTQKEATALYGNYSTLALSMFNLALALITPISIAFMPALAKAKAEKKYRGFCDCVDSALSFTAFITAPVVLGMAVFSEEILALLFGEAAAGVGAPLLVLICPGIIFMSYILIINSSLEALNRPGLATISLVVGIAIKTIISGILIGKADFGISGAPLGTVVSYAVSLFISLIMLSHILGYNVPVLTKSFLPYLAASISVLMSRMVYDAVLFSLGNVISLGFAILSCALIYIALSAFLGLFARRNITKIANFTKLS